MAQHTSTEQIAGKPHFTESAPLGAHSASQPPRAAQMEPLPCVPARSRVSERKPLNRRASSSGDYRYFGPPPRSLAPQPGIQCGAERGKRMRSPVCTLTSDDYRRGSLADAARTCRLFSLSAASRCCRCCCPREKCRGSGCFFFSGRDDLFAALEFAGKCDEALCERCVLESYCRRVCVGFCLIGVRWVVAQDRMIIMSLAF